ncbi:YidC/Oxa1 family membrane protein insertase [Phytohabitans suffuscus]
MLDYVVNLAHSAVSAIAVGVAPAFGPAATAVAIVLFTVLVRLLISPLSWAQIRGARVSPLVGCLPALAQAPFFFVMYRLFTATGGPDDLLDATLAGVPLGYHLTGGLTAAAVPVYAVLLVLLAALARLSSKRMREAMPAAPAAAPPSPKAERAPSPKAERAPSPKAERAPGPKAERAPSPEVERAQEQVRRVMVLLPYGTLAVAVFVPLAAGLYLLTTTAWTALEQGVLRRYR